MEVEEGEAEEGRSRKRWQPEFLHLLLLLLSVACIRRDGLLGTNALSLSDGRARTRASDTRVSIELMTSAACCAAIITFVKSVSPSSALQPTARHR